MRPSRRTPTIAALLLVAAAALALSACAGPAATSPAETAARTETTAPQAPLKIFAAASLQASFDELADAFTAAAPEYAVDPIVYDGSQALATQIQDGADVDVVAFASEASIAPLTDATLVGATRLFATNTLQIAVPAGNPKGIRTLGDLADPSTSVVLCAVEVPCGAASQKLLAAAGVAVTPVSEETSVSAVVRRVAQGEADAGLVYATDIHDSAGVLEGIEPEGASGVVNRYPIAVATNAPSTAAAQAFVDFVLSDAGQRILAAHGFGAA
ncbi:molybdate ABC transporter substrate-binding protein [Microbacterium flavum]|uniref:Molybdate ABC transporter substrate-binding protein n=1 Tax=Microbacterium flavum TaxID=415216 RepID=A0ABS5XW74_9MICO|nr:molybdate ABC transporter substrate-binding protein [Microbacterium flavum]MBT8798764.1 molybdate ABC transporter substrate-binding protein [Microbacterium flavum]